MHYHYYSTLGNDVEFEYRILNEKATIVHKTIDGTDILFSYRIGRNATGMIKFFMYFVSYIMSIYLLISSFNVDDYNVLYSVLPTVLVICGLINSIASFKMSDFTVKRRFIGAVASNSNYELDTIVKSKNIEDLRNNVHKLSKQIKVKENSLPIGT